MKIRRFRIVFVFQTPIYEGVSELAPEARKNIAPAARPGTKAAKVRGPEGRKIDSNNLSPLTGLVF